ncbi:MAG TPA: Na+/H+ antiporter [Povalibacter sp.]|uniref:Na+/H+ antiporter n=1 Tax=Povalibacter sp. TaxID=1962978 RepID=UPI002CC7DDFF|nr:Na+/H+ antiporter [Povalibacter sp.]HMN45044.1 Na+/H+ antiporter [Povalibacter sp.]
MGAIEIVLAMLVAVVVSGVLVRLLPLPIPTPLVQIALGAAITALSEHQVRLDPEVFFLLFLPPLLFLDGWRIPKEGLFRDKDMILELALGLVILTVVGMGLLIHWMIPAMPFAVAFALAAIVSPTDPVAVSAITERIPVPKRVMHVLEGESLLNDASGLVCFRFAVAAAVTGTFSLSNAALTLVWVALGGVAAGVGVTWAISWLKNLISRHYGENPGSQVLISLLIPFAAYQVAEHLGCSGILAAVAAGITMSYAELSGRALASTRVQRTAVWDTMQFALNGVMFVLLGEQLPGIFENAVTTVQESNHENPWWLAVYVLAINLGLACLRFAWVWVSMSLSAFAARRRGLDPRPAPTWRTVAAMSLAGARGAITLAGVLTLPLALPGGEAFPARDLAIFLAAGVIILSLVAASIALPRLLAGLEIPPDSHEKQSEDQARVAAAQAAIQSIEQALHDLAEGQPDADLYADAATRVMDFYRRRIEGLTGVEENASRLRRGDSLEGQLRLAGLNAERETIFAMARHHAISDECSRKLVREIDLMEERLR